MSKLILPGKKPTISKSNVTLVQQTDHMLAEAMSVMSNEITRLGLKSRSGKSLDANENRIIQGHIKALIEINKDTREQDKARNFEDMGTEELVQVLLSLLHPDELRRILKEYLQDEQGAQNEQQK